MLELNRDMVARKEITRTLRPFDEHERFGGENVIPPDVRELVWTAQAIKVEVIHRRASTGELVHQGEGRTGHVVRHAVPAADGTRECRLAGAELTAERHEQWRTRGAAESLSPVDQFGLG